jgi:putative restriction endonuclease
MTEKNWEEWLDRLYNLRRDKRGLHERPHKPILLLSVIDLLDRGAITANEIPLSDELVRSFRRHFEVVRAEDDQPTIQNPYFHLSGDDFWRLIPKPGEPMFYRPGATGGAPSVAELRRRVAYAQFDDGLWALVGDPKARSLLRKALVARYFPLKRDALDSLDRDTLPETPASRDEDVPGRDAAFRRTILEIYDYRCAACGTRVVLDQSISLAEAAHLIPFVISRNDNPTNGIALCPNHHWAMDRHLVAPCPDRRRRAGIWRINGDRLDERIEGQRDLVALDGKPVIPPGEQKFYPAPESLRWREEHLTASA